MAQVSHRYSSDLRCMPEIRAFVADVCRTAWRAEDAAPAVHQLELAVHEAATNIVRHAYQGEAGRPIQVVVDASPEQVTVTLYHQGQDIDLGSIRPPAFDGSREGGFGVYLIRELVDELVYSRDDTGRRWVTLTKYRAAPGRGKASMDLTVDSIGDVAVVRLNFEQFDAGNSEEFKASMASVLAASSRVVLDLGRVQFVDSSGCGAIISCLKRTAEAGGDLKLCNVTPQVRTIFELIRLHRICEIVPTREDAVKAFARK